MSRPTSLIITCIDPNKRSPSPTTLSFKTCSEGSDNYPQNAYLIPSSPFNPLQSAKTGSLNRKNTLGSLREAVNGDGSSSATTGSFRNVSDSTAPTSVDPDTPTKPKTPAIDPARLRGELDRAEGTPRRQYSVEDTPVIENGSTDQEDQPSAPTVLLSENAGSGEGASQLAESDHSDHPPAPSNVESKTIQPNEGPSSSTGPGHVNNLSATLVPEPESGPSGDAGPRPAESEPLHSEDVSPPNNGADNRDPPQKRSLRHRVTDTLQPVKQKVSNIVFVKRHNGHSARKDVRVSQQTVLNADSQPLTFYDVRLPGVALVAKLVMAFPTLWKGMKVLCLGVLVTTDGEANELDISIKVHSCDLNPHKSIEPPYFLDADTRKARGRITEVNHGRDLGGEAQVAPPAASGTHIGLHDTHTKSYTTMEGPSNTVRRKSERGSRFETTVHHHAKENCKEHKGVNDKIPIRLFVVTDELYFGPVQVTINIKPKQGLKTLYNIKRVTSHYSARAPKLPIHEDFGTFELGDRPEKSEGAEWWAKVPWSKFWDVVVNA